jgi:hypothetical protein
VATTTELPSRPAGARVRFGSAAAVALVAVALVLASPPRAALAGPPDAGGAAPADDRAASRELVRLAERAADERRYPDALAAYEAALERDPSGPFATVARARVADLRAHAEGGFAPLARLDAVRRDPNGGGDRAAIEALERDLASFPPGRVRSEARVVVAEAYWHRLGEPRRAAAALAPVLDDPAADRLTQALALTELVAVDKELGDLDAALAAARAHPALAPRLTEELARLARRGPLRAGALGLVGALAAIGALSFARASARRRDPRPVVRAVVRPLAVAFSLYLGAGAALLVRLHGGEDARPFVWLGLGVLALDLVARAWRLAAADERPLARAVRAASCAAGVVAMAFLILERSGAGYLDALGL